MKKIMFNDRYGLTEAVLDGRKTQTRRIAYEKPFKYYCNCGFYTEGKDKGKIALRRNGGTELLSKHTRCLAASSTSTGTAILSFSFTISN